MEDPVHVSESGWRIQYMYPFSQCLLREEILPHDLIQFVQGELHVEQDGLVLFGPHGVLQYPV